MQMVTKRTRERDGEREKRAREQFNKANILFLRAGTDKCKIITVVYCMYIKVLYVY